MNPVQIQLGRPALQIGALFRRQVRHDEAIGAGRSCLAKQRIPAEPHERIGIAHQQHGNAVVLLFKSPKPFQRFFQRHSGLQRPLRRRLDGRSVCQWIAKRHPQLDHIRAGLGDGLQQRHRGLHLRKAGG